MHDYPCRWRGEPRCCGSAACGSPLVRQESCVLTVADFGALYEKHHATHSLAELGFRFATCQTCSVREDPEAMIGSRLRERFESIFGESISCLDCEAEARRLDRLSIRDILEDRRAIAAGIVRRAPGRLPRWSFWGLVVRVAPGLARVAVSRLIVSTCRNADDDVA